jgi:hypothetical protein
MDPVLGMPELASAVHGWIFWSALFHFPFQMRKKSYMLSCSQFMTVSIALNVELVFRSSWIFDGRSKPPS